MFAKIIPFAAATSLTVGTVSVALAGAENLSNSGFGRSNPPDLIEESVQPLMRNRDGTQEFGLKPFIAEDRAMSDFTSPSSD
jgi:hypothetical protein